MKFPQSMLIKKEGSPLPLLLATFKLYYHGRNPVTICPSSYHLAAFHKRNLKRPIKVLYTWRLLLVLPSLPQASYFVA